MEPSGSWDPGPVYPPEMTPAYVPPGPGYAPPPPEPCVPCWNFVSAPALLPGFGQPYNPGYSYSQCNACLAPPAYVPVCYQQTDPLLSFASAALLLSSGYSRGGRGLHRRL